MDSRSGYREDNWKVEPYNVAPDAFDMAMAELNGVSMTLCRRRKSANGDCKIVVS